MEQTVKLYLSEAKNNIANNNFGKAYAFYLLVLKLMPHLKKDLAHEFGVAWDKWSKDLYRLGRIGDLFSMYEQGCSVFIQSEALHHHMGCCLFQMGMKLEAVGMFRKTLTLNENNFGALIDLENSSRGLVDSWHFLMLNDIKRNQCFATAIQNTLASMDWDDCVLDIGSGTALLSMLAVRHGAAKVHACEMSEVMHCVASDCVLENNMSSKVELIHSESTELCVGGTSLPQKAALVITETVDAGLLGEGVAHTLNHAWNHLLLPPDQGGQVIPHSATVYCVLVECESLWKKHSCVNYDIPNLLITSGVAKNVGNVTKEFAPNLNGHSVVRVLNTCQSEPYTSEQMKNLTHRVLSEPSKLVDVNFNDPQSLEKIALEEFAPVSADFHIVSTGYVDAVVLWFQLNADSEKTCIIDTAIGSEFCWDQAVYPVRVIAEHKTVTESLLSKNIQEQHQGAKNAVGRLHVQETDIVRVNYSVHVDRFQMESIDKMSFCKQSTTSYPQILPADSNQLVCDVHIRTYEDNISRINDVMYSNSYFSAVCKHCQLLQSAVILDVCSGFDMLSFKFWQAMTPKPEIHKYCQNSSVQEAYSAVSAHINANVELLEEIPCSPVYDVVVSDVIEPSGLLSPKALSYIASAKMCLKEGGVVVPSNMRVIVQGINSDELLSKCMVTNDHNTLGIKIANSINDFRVSWHSDLDMDKLNHATLSDKAVALTIDFNAKDAQNRDFTSVKQSIVLKVTKPGILHAILFWFELDLDSDNCIDTSDSKNHWKQAAYILPKTKWLNVHVDKEIVITTTCPGDMLLFSLSNYGA